MLFRNICGSKLPAVIRWGYPHMFGKNFGKITGVGVADLIGNLCNRTIIFLQISLCSADAECSLILGKCLSGFRMEFAGKSG